MTFTITLAIVMSKLVIVIALWLAGCVPIILICFPPGRAAAMTVVIVLWLHGSIVVG